MEHHALICPLRIDGACYGVHFDTDGVGTLEYLAGMAVPDLQEVPEGLALRQVPGGFYVAFGCTVERMHATYERIFHGRDRFGEWKQDPARSCFERYAPGTASGEDPVPIYVPMVE